MQFGISTHLYHDQRLDREHLAQIAGYGFEAIELFATRSHFDYHDPAAVDALADWLAASGLTLRSVHAPITEQFGAGDQWAPTFSNAVGRRRPAAGGGRRDGRGAGHCPADSVQRPGRPPRDARGRRPAPGTTTARRPSRSVEEICRLAEPLGVRVALEVIPNALSTPAALVSAAGARRRRRRSPASASTSGTRSSAATCRMRSRPSPST